MSGTEGPSSPLGQTTARSLTLDTEPYLSCDDCFDQVDEFVEALLSDRDLDDDRTAMRIHLAGCAACAEESKSLICLVAEQDGVNPVPALQRLDVGRG